MSEKVMECVPNFSEGNDAGKVREIVRAMQVDGVSLLDWSLDADHNRSVVTIAGPPAAVLEAAVRGVGRAAQLIDLTKQSGVHPRIGAADVVPFVPIKGMSLVECAMMAHKAGQEIWKRHGIPAYFYEAAATRPDRALLENLRQGQFEGLRDAVKREVARRPDVGGPNLHPTAGASAVGARKLLIAYNVYLDTDNVAIARAVARAIRASDGGLNGLKAIGVLAHGQAQVPMNITDFRVTPVGTVFAAVKREAAKLGSKPVRAELIGLLPEEAYERESEWIRLVEGFDASKSVLERKLEEPSNWP